jgi:hypothetical protein
VLLLVAFPAVLAKVGEAGSGKRVPKQVHTKGEYQALSRHGPSAWMDPMSVCSNIMIDEEFCLQRYNAM